MTKTVKPKKVYEYSGTVLDSQEELDFCYWAQEGVEHGLLESWDFHKHSYPLSPKQTRTVEVQLKTKVKIVEKHLLHDHVYTPDFIIKTTDKFEKTFPKHGLVQSADEPNVYVIDTKGAFAKNGGGRSFSINQKWLYHVHSTYVNKVIASGNTKSNWFIKTWVSAITRLQPKKGEVRKCYKTTPTVGDFA